MNVRKLAVSAVITGAVITGGIGVAAADASTRAENCGANRVCLYLNADFTGKFAERAPGGPVVNVSATYDNQMSSWRNLTNTDAAWYEDANGRGRCVTMGARTSDSSIDWSQDDELSSWKTSGGC